MDWHSFFVDDMTLSLCLFIFTYHGHKYTTLQKIKGRPSLLLRLRCGGATDFLLICVDFLLLPLTFWHVTMTTLKTVLYSHNLFSHLSCVAAAMCIIDEMCVCLSSATRAHRVTFWRFPISPRRARRRRRRQKSREEEEEEKDFSFLAGVQSFTPILPPTPMLWMWLDAGTFAAQPSIWLYWKWEASIRVSHSFSPGFRKPLAPLMDEKSDVCNVGDSAMGWNLHESLAFSFFFSQLSWSLPVAFGREPKANIERITMRFDYFSRHTHTHT